MSQYTVTVVISNKLSQDDWDCIETFKRKAEQLFDCDVFKSTSHDIHAHMEWNADQLIKSKISLLKEDFLKSLLMSFRPFYAKDEASNFKRVLNILKKHSDDAVVKAELELYRKEWDNALLGGAIRIEDDNGPLTAARLMDLWFNAHYFHSDKNKTIELNQLKSCLPPDSVKYLLVNSVYNSVMIIQKLYRVLYQLKRP
jgi:hypothetical protein